MNQWRLIFCLALLALIVFSGCVQPPEEAPEEIEITTTTLTVFVKDEEGQAVENALVKVIDPSTSQAIDELMTDKFGLAVFDLANGLYSVEAVAEGFSKNVKEVLVKELMPEKIEIMLVVIEVKPEVPLVPEIPEGKARLMVSVVDSSAQALESVSVQVLDSLKQAILESALTDVSGQAAIFVEAGSYFVEASKEGFLLKSRNVTVEAGRTKEVNFILLEKAVPGETYLKIRTRTLVNVAIPDVKVEVLSSDLIDVLATGVSDSRGETVFTDLPEGLYSVRVSKKGFQTMTKGPIQVLKTASAGLTFKMPRSYDTNSNLSPDQDKGCGCGA